MKNIKIVQEAIFSSTNEIRGTSYSSRIKDKKYQIKIFENQLDGSEHFALIKGKISPSKNTRVRVISSNLVESYFKYGNKYWITL